MESTQLEWLPVVPYPLLVPFLGLLAPVFGVKSDFQVSVNPQHVATEDSAAAPVKTICLTGVPTRIILD